MTIQRELEALGFVVMGTGGGCEAMWLKLASGLEVYITDGDSCLPSEGYEIYTTFWQDDEWVEGRDESFSTVQQVANLLTDMQEIV